MTSLSVVPKNFEYKFVVQYVDVDVHSGRPFISGPLNLAKHHSEDPVIAQLV